MFKKFNKIEDYFLDKLTDVVMWWIRKNKFKKHKYHFKRLLRIIELQIFGGWIIISGVWQYMKGNHIPVLAINGSLLIFLILMHFLFKKMDLQTIKAYSLWFENRKNPLIYKIVKEVNQESWEKDRRMRKFELVMHAFFFLFQALFHSPLVILPLFGIVQGYIFYVFDFDEPEYKEAPKELTEIEKVKIRDILKIQRPSFI